MRKLLTAIALMTLLPSSHALIDAYIGTEKTLPTLELPYDVQFAGIGNDLLILRIFAQAPDEKVGEPRAMRVNIFDHLVRGDGPRADFSKSRLLRSVDLAVPGRLRPTVPHTVNIKRSELAGAVLVMDFWKRSEGHLVTYEIYLEDLWRFQEKTEANKPPEAMAVKRPPSNQSQAPAMPHL